LWFTGQYPGEWDEVDFALALRDYDIVAQQPHFPGYPVYVWFSHMAMYLVKGEVQALCLVSAIFGSLAILPLYYLTQSMYSRRVAVLACLLFLVNPACWLYSERPLSEATGLFFLILSLYLLFLGIGREKPFNPSEVGGHAGPVPFWYRAGPPLPNPWTPTLGAFFMGLTLGVRLDYFPFLSSLFYVLTYTHKRYSIIELLCFFGALV
jgi:hypothetical protein